MFEVFIVVVWWIVVVLCGGVFVWYQVDEFVVFVFFEFLSDVGLVLDDVDYVIFGNVLYGGGNFVCFVVFRVGLLISVLVMIIDI